MRVFTMLVCLICIAAPAHASPQRSADVATPEVILSWINQYRLKPEPHRVAEAMRLAGRVGAFKDPETAGVYVGFLAGVLNANPARAEAIVEKILPLPPEQQWVLVRSIAYSGLPHWKGLLHGFKMHMPSRAVMIDMHLDGRLATLEQLIVESEKPSLIERLFPGKDDPKEVRLEPSPDLIDTYWGFYFAAGAYEPVAKLISMLRWSTESDDVELLTLGGMAKYTLATNAARNPELLKMLQWSVRYQDKVVAKALSEVIVAAETVETSKIRKDAFAAIEELKRKGPGYKRKIAGWGQVGQGVLSLGCIGAAVAGAVALGLPCVIGGAVSSAALNAWAAD